MRMKHRAEGAEERLLACAKQEFLEKGFADSSVRSIAERAGVTTGTLYARFADKSELFGALVREGADALYSYFDAVQREFAAFPPDRQRREMHTYVNGKMDRMMDIIYDHFDAFKLIVCCSAGSGYEHYIDRMIEYETDSTERFIAMLRETGVAVKEIRRDLNHMLASALFNGVFEVVAHDLPKEEAIVYVRQVTAFFDAGWDRLFGL